MTQLRRCVVRWVCREGVRVRWWPRFHGNSCRSNRCMANRRCARAVCTRTARGAGHGLAPPTVRRDPGSPDTGDRRRGCAGHAPDYVRGDHLADDPACGVSGCCGPVPARAGFVCRRCRAQRFSSGEHRLGRDDADVRDADRWSDVCCDLLRLRGSEDPVHGPERRGLRVPIRDGARFAVARVGRRLRSSCADHWCRARSGAAARARRSFLLAPCGEAA